MTISTTCHASRYYEPAGRKSRRDKRCSPVVAVRRIHYINIIIYVLQFIISNQFSHRPCYSECVVRERKKERKSRRRGTENNNHAAIG
jgi:hypothetical protein